MNRIKSKTKPYKSCDFVRIIKINISFSSYFEYCIHLHEHSTILLFMILLMISEIHVGTD